MRNIFSLIIVAIFLGSSLAYAIDDTIPTFDYIKSSMNEDGGYDIYGKNIPSDPSRVNIMVNDKKLNNTNIVLGKDKIHLRNFYPNAGSFSIEFMKVEYGSGGTAKYVTDIKTDSIKIRKNDTIGFNGKIIRENKNSYDVITLPFINNISSDILLGQESVKSERKLIINGTEKPLEAFAGEYKDDVYYFSPEGITFREKNLVDRINTMSLKIDGLDSNYIVIIRENIDLAAPNQIQVEDMWTSKYLKLFFSEPRNFNNLNNKEIFINGTKIEKTNATLSLNQLIIRFDISKLPIDQDVLSVVLKNTLTNEYSNVHIIHVGSYSLPKITEIDTGDWESGNFTFNIKGSPITFFGDIYKLEVNINGTWYTREGTKEPVKDGSGIIQKDSDGNDRFNIKNKIEMKRNGEGIEFDFFYSLLKEGKNILFIKNGNTLRQSNMISFVKKSTQAINYNYLTWTTLTENTKKESMTFEIGKDIDQKVNSATMIVTDRNISLWRLKLANIKNNEFYSLDFTLNTNLTINPFSNIKLDTTNLETIKNGDTYSFVLKKQGFGKDFKADSELLSTINELYNTSSKAFSLNTGEISLKKLWEDNTYETLVTLKNPLKASVSYTYTNNMCFDGVKDFCSITGDWDPLLSLVFNTSWDPILIKSSTQDIISTDHGVTAIIGKKNISTIVAQDFKNEKFIKVQNILTKLYENLKTKGSIYVPTFRKATNRLLFALRNFELKINRTESISQVKSSLKTINEVLRKAKKE